MNYITILQWMGDTSDTVFTISRGANTILVLSGSGIWDFQKNNVVVETDSEKSANLSISATGTGTIRFRRRYNNALIETKYVISSSNVSSYLLTESQANIQGENDDLFIQED